MTLPYDYTIVTESFDPQTPNGYVAVDRYDRDGEVIDRVADFYGCDDRTVDLAQLLAGYLNLTRGWDDA